MEHIVNPVDLKRLLALDPVLKTIIDTYGSPAVISRPEGYISLVKIILEQQVSLASAVAHFRKLNSYMGEFTPKRLLSLTDEELRECHISRQKTAYLRGLSQAILSGELQLENLSTMQEDDVRKQLTKLKGIGDWTADIYLMFCLRSKNIFPIGDIVLVNTLKELYGLQSREDMLEHSKQWEPNRSLATQLLWHHYLKKRGRVFPFEDGSY